MFAKRVRNRTHARDRIVMHRARGKKRNERETREDGKRAPCLLDTLDEFVRRRFSASNVLLSAVSNTAETRFSLPLRFSHQETLPSFREK